MEKYSGKKSDKMAPDKRFKVKQIVVIPRMC